MSAGLFAVIKNISVLADDTATMLETASKNTAGVLGDDLAVNAEKASGFSASRELPVLWKIAKGSFVNKFIIIPIMMFLSAFFPVIITPILIAGAIFLSLEGVEKIIEIIIEKKSKKKENEDIKKIKENKEDILKIENKKIKAAILTDFILSIEIVLIALSTVIKEPIEIQILVVSIVSILATIGVYGIVALIVRMDDIGLWFIRKSIKKEEKNKIITYEITKPLFLIGKFFIKSMSFLIKSLTYIGTIAMLMVGGGIFVHNIEKLHHLTEGQNIYTTIIIEILLSISIGIFTYFVIEALKRIKRNF